MSLSSYVPRPCSVAFVLITLSAGPTLAQDEAASPFGAAPLPDTETAAPAAPIRPMVDLPRDVISGDVGDLDSYANAGTAGFSTSRNDINQDIGLTPIIDLTTPKLRIKGGGF